MIQESGVDSAGYDDSVSFYVNQEQDDYIRGIIADSPALKYKAQYMRLLIEKYLRKGRKYPYWWPRSASE